MDVVVNYWAVLAATVVSMVVGAIWYAMPVFGKTWAKLAKIDLTKNKGSILKPMTLTVLCSLMTAYVLAHVAYLSNQFFGHSFLQDTVTTAFWLWLGLTAARILVHDAFESRPVKLSIITVSHEFVTLVLMGLIIGWIGV